MEESWDSQKVAEHMLNVLPRLSRAIAQRVQSQEGDATMMQSFTLFTLIEEPMTVSDLARKRHVSLQSASTLVQTLVERGWVTRVRKPDDRRQYLLEVTEAGIARAEETKTLFSDYTTELLSSLSEEEIAAAKVFIPALERIILNIGDPISR